MRFRKTLTFTLDYEADPEFYQEALTIEDMLKIDKEGAEKDFLITVNDPNAELKIEVELLEECRSSNKPLEFPKKKEKTILNGSRVEIKIVKSHSTSSYWYAEVWSVPNQGSEFCEWRGSTFPTQDEALKDVPELSSL